MMKYEVKLFSVRISHFLICIFLNWKPCQPGASEHRGLTISVLLWLCRWLIG